MNDSIVDKHVKCVLRNGMVIEGVAVEWSDGRVVLKSLDGESLMIVHKPTDDILMTKVVLSKESSEIVEVPAQPTEVQQQVKSKLQEAQQLVDDPELQKKSVDELRQMILEQERQIIAQKKKEHFGTAGAAKVTQYSSPFSPRSNASGRTAYQPRKIPSWAYGRPPRKGE